MGELYTKQEGSVSYDNLFAGINVDVTHKGVNLQSGQGLVRRGTVLGIITASGLAVRVDSTKVDGSQTANCILADDTDTTAGNVVAVAYTSGLFNRQALVFGGTDTATQHENTLRDVGIFLKDNIPY